MAFQNDLFANFPVITYNGQTAIDITKNVDMIANLVSNDQVLTAFQMNQSLRSDQLSSKLYGDPNLEWLLFMSNEMIDGFDWTMDQQQFYTYMDRKYGDWVLTQQQISYWLNNWYESPDISVSTYDALDPSLVKYYEPIYDAGYNILGYSRAQIDWVVSTNHLVQYCFTNAVTVPLFTNNEVVTVTWDNLGNTSTGQVCYQNNTPGGLSLNIQHVQGPYNYSNSITAANFSIVGSQSNAIITIPSTSDMLINIYNTVSALEDVYYSPVTIFDDENMKNVNKSYMYYLPNTFVSQTVSELQALF